MSQRKAYSRDSPFKGLHTNSHVDEHMWNPNSLPTHWQLSHLRFTAPSGVWTGVSEWVCARACVCGLTVTSRWVENRVHATVTWAQRHMAKEEGRNNQKSLVAVVVVGSNTADAQQSHPGQRSQEVLLQFLLHCKISSACEPEKYIDKLKHTQNSLVFQQTTHPTLHLATFPTEKNWWMLVEIEEGKKIKEHHENQSINSSTRMGDQDRELTMW